MIKAVLIDVDNTLLDFNKCAESSIKRAFSEKNIEYTPEVFSAFTRINDALWVQIEKGLLTRAEHAKIRWNRIFSELNIKLDGIEFEKIFIKHLDESDVPVENAESILKYLSAKYPIYAASNGTQQQQTKRLEKAGLLKYINAVFTSEKMGAHKPNAGFFENCLKELPVLGKSDIMLIGDSLEADIKGAVDFGIKCCWFNYFGLEKPKDISPDYTVDSLLDIKEIL